MKKPQSAMQEQELFVIESSEGFGFSQIEGIFTDYELAEKALVSLIREINERIERKRSEARLKKKRLPFDNIYTMRKPDEDEPSYFLSYDNGSTSISLKKIAANEVHPSDTIARYLTIKKSDSAQTVEKRILGHAAGKIYESPDCWDDDFNE